MFLILELCEGGELFDRLHAQAGSHYDEAQAARLMHSMCAAISYIHFRGISHRFVRVALLAVFDSLTVGPRFAPTPTGTLSWRTLSLKAKTRTRT